MEHIAPGRQVHARPGNDKEHDATTVLRISLNEAACKVRQGGPRDDADDLALSTWAGVLPFARQHLAPIRDEQCVAEAPAYVRDWVASGAARPAG